MGRPRSGDSNERTTTFLRVLAETGSLATAATESGTDGNRVLRLLDRDPQFRQAALALSEKAA